MPNLPTGKLWLSFANYTTKVDGLQHNPSHEDGEKKTSESLETWRHDSNHFYPISDRN